MHPDHNTEEAIRYLDKIAAEEVTEPRIIRVYATNVIDIFDDQGNYTGYDAEPREYEITPSQLVDLVTSHFIDTFTVGRVDDEILP